MNTEQALVRRARLLGDKRAFSALVGIHQSRIRTLLFRLCRNYDVADDLGQDVFLKAYEKLGTFRGDAGFGTWVYRIAYNAFLSFERDRRRRAEVTAQYASELKVLAERYESISDAQIDLEEAMLSLKPEESAAITLCHSFGCSHSEAAEVLEIPMGTVKTHIHRGRTKLVNLLSRDERRRHHGT